MSERTTTKLVADALTMAIWRRKMPTGVIVHSDRGSQYCAHVYQRLLQNNQMICSMRKKGDCYDNSAMASWNHSLKVEAIHGERFTTREMAREQVFEYIEVYYNRKRLHSTLGYLSPESFEAQKVCLTGCPENRGKINVWHSNFFTHLDAWRDSCVSHPAVRLV